MKLVRRLGLSLLIIILLPVAIPAGLFIGLYRVFHNVWTR